MPYNNYSNRRYKRKPRSRKYQRKNIFWHRLNNKVQHLAKRLNTEKKCIDVSNSTQAFGQTGTVIQLTNLVQGLTDITRVGSQVKITSAYIQIYLTLNAIAPHSIVRLLLVHDKQTNQAVYATSDLLETVGTASSIVSPLNLDNKFRFQILKDKRYVLSSAGPSNRVVKMFIPLQQLIRYDANAGTIADLSSSSLSLVLISDEATNMPNANYFVRLRYVDN